MLRGELSNKPLAICAVDYRVLLDQKKSYLWFIKNVPELLLHKSYENTMRKALPWKKHAELWLERQFERRIAVISVGVPLVSRAIDMVVGDAGVAETYHHESPAEFREWIRFTRQLYRVFTDDPVLLGLDEIMTPFPGWEARL